MGRVGSHQMCTRQQKYTAVERNLVSGRCWGAPPLRVQCFNKVCRRTFQCSFLLCSLAADLFPVDVSDLFQPTKDTLFCAVPDSTAGERVNNTGKR